MAAEAESPDIGKVAASASLHHRDDVICVPKTAAIQSLQSPVSEQPHPGSCTAAAQVVPCCDRILPACRAHAPVALKGAFTQIGGIRPQFPLVNTERGAERSAAWWNLEVAPAAEIAPTRAFWQIEAPRRATGKRTLRGLLPVVHGTRLHGASGGIDVRFNVNMLDEKDALRVVLVAPRNPLNIGAAARAMSNFGFFHLRVVNPYDIAYAEARSAVNAAEVLARSEEYPTTANAVADCTLVVGTTAIGHRALAHPLRRLEAGGRLIREAMQTAGPVALLFGSEKFGLSNDDLSYCQWLLHIPARHEHASMNLGQAVAVCLYELIRSDAEEQREPVNTRPARAADIDRIADMLIEGGRLSGYVKEDIEASTEQKIRRAVRRASLLEADAPLWLGLTRQLLWKLRGKTPKYNEEE